MLSDKFLNELRELSDIEKLQVVQILVNDLASKADETRPLSGKQYDVWSPYDAAGAAQTLTRMLEEDRDHKNG